jgi:chemotaxis protein MotB
MARKHKHEEHLNHEAWAIPYGDLITLLLAFFVVMYAISSVNEGKYRVLSDSLVAAFRGTPQTLEPVQVGEKQRGSGADIKATLVEQKMIEGQPRSMLAALPVKTPLPTRAEEEAAKPEPLTRQQTLAAKALQKVADEVEHAMDDLVKANMVVVRRKDFFIEVEIRTDILFPSAKAQLSPGAVDVIERLGTTLAPFPNPIRVEGHTDNRPIKTVAFFSNWELSAARAGSVVRVLASRGVSPDRLAVIGYGENRPSHPNDTQEGRNANRRVIIVILSTDVNKPDVPALPEFDGSAQPENPGATTLATETIGAAALPAAPVSPDSATAIPAPLPSATPAVPGEAAR